MINKIDIPAVQEKLTNLRQSIANVAGHSRVIGISAVTGEKVKETMKRVLNLIKAMPKQTDLELFTEEEDRVSFEEEVEEGDFEVLTDENYPGQFRIIGGHIEKVC